MGQYEMGSTQSAPVMGHPAYYQQQPEGASYGQAAGYQQVPPMVVQNPPLQVLPGEYSGKWSTGLCGCCTDCNSCCLTCWCPCISFGQIAEVVDEGQSSCCVHATIYTLLLYVGMPCVYSCMWRGKLRQKYRLEPGCCGDFGIHCCCEFCALCQEQRELKSRGLDPFLGWEANRVNYVQPMAVPTPPGAMLK